MTGGQDWASELIETGGKEVKEDDLVKLVEAAGALFRWLEAFERRVQELELKNTCFGPLKPSGSSAAEATVRCMEQVASGPAIEFSRQAAYVKSQKADKPKREWWVVVKREGEIIGAYDREVQADIIAAQSPLYSVVRVTPAPTDAEIAAASLVACENYLAGNSFDKSLEAFANHLLGRTER